MSIASADIRPIYPVLSACTISNADNVFMSGIAIPNDLTEPVAALEAENAELRLALAPLDVTIPYEWHLTGVESTIFRMLLKNEVVTKRTIVFAIDGRWASAADMKKIDVFIHRIRAKTREIGVIIE